MTAMPMFLFEILYIEIVNWKFISWMDQSHQIKIHEKKQEKLNFMMVVYKPNSWF